VLAPESVAVAGASRRPGTVGRVIMDNIRGGGYPGRVYAVNPHARQIGGERCLSSVLDLPEPADLAVVAVPAAAVVDVAEQCGQRGVRSLVVITSGLDAAACADLLAVCRRHGMRLVGPNCFGVAVPGLGLDATFGASRPRPGVAGLVSQSGGQGIALMDQLSPLGIGISSFASVGSPARTSRTSLALAGPKPISSSISSSMNTGTVSHPRIRAGRGRWSRPARQKSPARDMGSEGGPWSRPGDDSHPYGRRDQRVMLWQSFAVCGLVRGKTGGSVDAHRPGGTRSRNH
jgi:predicted CoA-binding protein